jgi:hypothetical protein
MSDEQKKEPDVEEVVTEFEGGIRVRSGFEAQEVEPGVVAFNIFGPVFEFDGDDEDLDDEEDGDNQPEPQT